MAAVVVGQTQRATSDTTAVTQRSQAVEVEALHQLTAPCLARAVMVGLVAFGSRLTSEDKS